MSKNKPTAPDYIKVDKDKILKNDSFCILPWIHLHSSTTGNSGPCCIAQSARHDQGHGNSKKHSLLEIVNSEGMNQLRLDMLKGKKNKDCTSCYEQEEKGTLSFRLDSQVKWGHHLDEVLKTNQDGSLDDFKMKYFDIRFSNICNFKCRTCNSEYSSQWEKEDKQNNLLDHNIALKSGNTPGFFKEVLDQIENIEVAYFAGGEPLITDEHYLLLEAMIETKRTDIELRYNTNLSNFRYKNKDIFDIWKNFDKQIKIAASIDHFGKKAEYIRHGTNWELVEQNIFEIKKMPNINFTINTVLSIFNCLTIYDFYKYLIDNKIYTPDDDHFQIYNMTSPEWFVCHVLPRRLQKKATTSMRKTIEYMKKHGFTDDHLIQLQQSIEYLNQESTWKLYKDDFKKEIRRVDRIRRESFVNNFPELANLYDKTLDTILP